MPASFQLHGITDVRKRGQALASRFPARLRQAVRIEAEKIMTDSKRNYVPVDNGTLRASGTVTQVSTDGHTVEFVLSFGGPASPYAVAIHEHPSSSSPPSWRDTEVNFHPAGRGPKYLERPLLAAAPHIACNVAARLRGDGEGTISKGKD